MVQASKINCVTKEIFRLKVDEKTWTDAELDNNPIDLAGKRLHLFQLPPDMPASCLDGVSLPVPRKNKWSKPVSVTYTANEGKDNQQILTVELKAQRMPNQQTLMEVRKGQLMPCKNQPISLYQGFEVIPHEDTIVPEISEGVHQLPAGLRQRCIPIGNGLNEGGPKEVGLMMANTKTTGKKRKRKSTVSPHDTQSSIMETPRLTLDSTDNDSDVAPLKKSKSVKKGSSQSNSNISVSPKKSRKRA